MATLLLGQASAFGRVIMRETFPWPITHDRRFRRNVESHAKLTLTLGLRWDYNGYPTSPQKGGIANSTTATPTPSSATTVIPPQRQTWTRTIGISSPEIGIAYGSATDGNPDRLRAILCDRFQRREFRGNYQRLAQCDTPECEADDAYLPVLTIGQAPPAFVSGFDVLAAAGNPGQYPTPNSAGSEPISTTPTTRSTCGTSRFNISCRVI